MRWRSGSAADNFGSSGRSTTRARFSISLCNGGATRRRPQSSCANCSGSRASRPRRSLPIGCAPTKAQLGLLARHEQGLRKNNRAENSHLPARRRERKMQRFKSPGSAQRFLSVYASVKKIRSTFSAILSPEPRSTSSEEALQNYRAEPFRLSFGQSQVIVTSPIKGKLCPLTAVNPTSVPIGRLSTSVMLRVRESSIP
jgi:DDE domain